MSDRGYFRTFALACLTIALTSIAGFAEEEAPDASAEEVSFTKQILPIFRANCQGCHQPARPSGEYVMTSFEGLLKGGESEMAAVVPGKPDESYLLDLVTPVGGVAGMPKNKDPLTEKELGLIRTWIEQGARDDSPESAKRVYDAEHPPVYTRPTVVTSLDYAPDGSLLAVAGFHETLLVSPSDGKLVARLIGMAERIESVRFSPDGTRLLVTGGQPGRMGEVQVWNVKSRKLALSVPVTYDTIYGGSWSPDGKTIAFGCSDNTVRAIDAETGEQVLFQGAHDDWVLDTTFSPDGTHLISVGRDMTCKLTEVKTERFVDNITSITPGALKGGINSAVTHPTRDEIVVGGADGVPKVYRIYRQTARRIGDDANLIRRLPELKGRVFGVAVSKNADWIAAVSSLDGAGEVATYRYDFSPDLPEDIKKIQAKRVQNRSAEEKKKLDAYRAKNVKLLARTEVGSSGLYAVDFHPDGKTLAVGGADGLVRIVETQSGKIVNEFSPAPITEDASQAAANEGTVTQRESSSYDGKESLPKGAKVTKLTATPESVTLRGRFDKVQLIVSAELESGDTVDVTRLAEVSGAEDIATVSRTGQVTSKADGEAQLSFSLNGASVNVPVSVGDTQADFEADFIRDVTPILSHLGCNAGTCHGAAKGKNGFKLSLRGYDPVLDVRALGDDLASRRINVASPDLSLMLLKSTGSVPHVGGQLFTPGDPNYRIVRNWIARGGRLDPSTPRVTGIEVFPKNPTIQDIGARQQFRVVATYADGSTRDVTAEAFLESGDTEIATLEGSALLEAIRRGEAPILARFEGSYAATTLTVMGNRDGFVWQEPEKWNTIDELVARKWQRVKVLPSRLTSDAEFLRRVYLDLTGLPPSAEKVRAFLADERPTQEKRGAVIEDLIGSKEYADYWTNKWADLLQVNRKFLGAEGAAAFREWIRAQVAENKPYDEFAREIITASGSNKDNPAASYYKILRSPEDAMENTTHLFLGVRFNCNKCHDHPFERWTQDQYYETAAYFARFGLKRDPASGKRRIGGTAVEGAKPLYEIVFEKDSGEVQHKRTGEVAPAVFPYEAEFSVDEDASRREKLAAWITSPDNRYFARSYVNRLWGYLFGVGLIEPIDDIRAGNPPTNPELLDYLTEEFIQSGFNVRHVLRLIANSRTYQLSIETNRWNADDETNYSHAIARRLPAEVLYDTIYRVTGAKTKIPGVPPGTRAAALPDVGVKLPDGFLNNLGRPARESACECERSNDLQLGPVMALVSGPTVGNAISDPDNAIAKLSADIEDDAKLVDELFMRILNRPATEKEIAAVKSVISQVESDHVALEIALKNAEEQWAKRKPKLEKAREERIAKAEKELAAYQKKIAPDVAAKQKAREERIAKAEADLKAYQAKRAERVAAWAKKHASNVEWIPLAPSSLKATNGATLTAEQDRSIRVSGKKDKGTYIVKVNTNLQGITGVRLEALPVKGLSGGGPGLPPNGNFVVTEFEVKAAPKGQPKQLKNVKLTKPLADFTQENFNINQAIDGKPRDQRGWAIANAGGVVHWATFQTDKAVGEKDGTLLQFAIHQYHNAADHRLARFRISVTTDQGQVGLSLPEELAAVVRTPEKQRSEEQKSLLTAYYDKIDGGLVAKRQALAEAKKPVPEDPGVTRLKKALEYAKQPVKEDSRLVRLRADVKQSAAQIENKRLTAAQDLAWALINSPAFLFNR